MHWGGGPWQSSRGGEGVHDGPGGGHAHAGCMVYLGDNWPEKYRGRLFTCNLHGKRVNSDKLNIKGSGYKSERAPDFLKVADAWFRGLELKYGPDGGVFLSDWSDIGECHDYDDIHRENGRIYKVTFGQPKSVSVNLAQKTNAELLKLQQHSNAWFARHARRLLQERAAIQTLPDDFRETVQKQFQNAKDHAIRLRLLWTLAVIEPDGLDEAFLSKLLSDDDPFVQGWAIQLSLEDQHVSPDFLNQLVSLAKSEASPVVRLFLASALQRLPLDGRWNLAGALLGHAEDADDANLPLMVWYGIEPLVAKDKTRALKLIVQSKLPLVRQHLARRAAALSK